MKHYSVELGEAGATLLYDGRPLFCEIGITTRVTRHPAVKLTPSAITEEESGDVRIAFPDPEEEWFHTLNRCDLVLHEAEGVLTVSLDAETRYPSRGLFLYNFASDDAITLHMHHASPDVRVMYSHLGSYFVEPQFFLGDPKHMGRGAVSVLYGDGERHCHLLPLPGDNFRSDIRGEDLVLSIGVNREHLLCGPILLISVAGDPFEAVHANYVQGRAEGAITVALRGERPAPEMLQGLGWCTWDACRRDVSSQLLYDKAQEFADAGVPLDYILIDDGWSVYDLAIPDSEEGRRLVSFKEDRTKFPEGLKKTVQTLKKKYGVKYVGVWHHLLGFWNGIHPDSEICAQVPEGICENLGEQIVIRPTEDGAYAFYDKWHTYLEHCGIDFVKVDGQAALGYRYEGMLPSVEASRAVHDGLERSVAEHFGSMMINCMGMAQENLLLRRRSPINRNSCDFSPAAEDGFARHLQDNLYNAIIERDLYHCDFDMFWTEHEDARRSAVLRAISGGPIYASDRLGHTDFDAFAPLLSAEGEVLHPDDTAQPTLDLVYTDCRREPVAQKLWNRSGDAYIVAAYAIALTPVTGQLRLSDLPGAHGSYLVYDYFARCYSVLDEGGAIELSLERGDLRLYTLYPIDGEGYAEVGDPDRYIGAAAPRTRRAVSSLLNPEA